MKKLLFVATLFLLPAMTAQAGLKAPALGPTTGTIYVCVAKFGFPGFPNMRMVKDADDCLPTEFLQTISSSLSIGVTCETENVGAGDGSFNIDAVCPAGDVVVSGGWSCVDGAKNVTDATIAENTFFFNNITPVGWQTVGHATAHDGSCTVCASCTPGACKDDPNDCLP